MPATICTFNSPAPPQPARLSESVATGGDHPALRVQSRSPGRASFRAVDEHSSNRTGLPTVSTNSRPASGTLTFGKPLRNHADALMAMRRLHSEEVRPGLPPPTRTPPLCGRARSMRLPSRRRGRARRFRQLREGRRTRCATYRCIRCCTSGGVSAPPLKSSPSTFWIRATCRPRNAAMCFVIAGSLAYGRPSSFNPDGARDARSRRLSAGSHRERVPALRRESPRFSSSRPAAEKNARAPLSNGSREHHRRVATPSPFEKPRREHPTPPHPACHCRAASPRAPRSPGRRCRPPAAGDQPTAIRSSRIPSSPDDTWMSVKSEVPPPTSTTSTSDTPASDSASLS